MTQRMTPARRFLALLAVVSLFMIAPRASAEPVPAKDDRLIAQLVCEILHRGHLSRPEIGDEMSQRLFRRFVKELDPNKLFFVKSDIDEFRKNESKLDDLLQKGDLSFAYDVYKRLMARIAERLKLVDEFLAANHDFTAKEELSTDVDKIPYAATPEELRERWRKRIKADLLSHRVGDKPLPEAEAREKVRTRYQGLLKRWKQCDNAELMEMYFSALSSSIDPHSIYMSPATLDDFAIAMRLNLDGIGALLRSENGQTIIVEIVPGGAAASDGRLKPNDKVIGVAQGDNQYVDTVDMKLRDVVKLIRGNRGTKVQLKVVPTGKLEPTVYELTRQKIELKSQEARGEVVEQGKKADGTPYKIGVIDLPSFYADREEQKSATEDVRKILKQFEKKKVDGVVLDLRRNGGGLLNEAMSLTGLFVDRGPLVQIKDAQGRVHSKDDPEPGTVYGGPLVVLVSRFSASASEILAGALQDYGRALVVGDPATHGKGTVQTVLDLANLLHNDNAKLGAMKLTIQQFYRVNGDSTQGRGVVSDVVLPSLTDVIATGESELDYALPFDQVKPVEHENLGLVSPELKALLRERSARRVKESAEFTKLAKDAALFKTRKDRKALSLNEKELREQFLKDDSDKLEQQIKEQTPTDNGSGDAVYKFKRNFVNNEVLNIMEDFLQGKRLATAR